MIAATAPRLTAVGTCTTGVRIIFTPMNASSTARPWLRYVNRSMAPARTKYSGRSPSTANALEVNRTNMSVVTPSAAGIESIAKITSVIAMATSAISNGVAESLPACLVSSRMPA